MSDNKRTVERYMQAFREGDHAAVLACLSDDVEWVIPGAAHLHGKVEFDGEIENPAFAGRPEIEVTRLVEEDDVVVAEGRVRTRRADGVALHLVFCDVFVMRGGRVRQLTSYLMEVPAAAVAIEATHARDEREASASGRTPS
jgi:ketosteroid isomerase-like protein